VAVFTFTPLLAVKEPYPHCTATGVFILPQVLRQALEPVYRLLHARRPLQPGDDLLGVVIAWEPIRVASGKYALDRQFIPPRSHHLAPLRLLLPVGSKYPNLLSHRKLRLSHRSRFGLSSAPLLSILSVPIDGTG
jgi:hypothetical protein